MSASMKDVANLAQVSVATVSYVINGTRNVSKDKRERVLKAIDQLHYNVNPIARNLRSGNSKIIGLVVSDMTNYFYMDIILAIDTLLKEQGYHLFYINSYESLENEKENIRSLLMQNVDGLIVAPVSDDCSYMNEIIGDKCPCVFFDRKPGGYRRDVVLSENLEGAKKSVEILINKGHRSIGFISTGMNNTMNERLDGYKTALRDHNIPILEQHIKIGTSLALRMNDLKTGEMYRLAKQLIEEDKVSAIFTGSLLSSIGLITYLKDCRSRVPEDLALITFDDTFWMDMFNLEITAMDQDRLAIGSAVAQLILKRINGDTSDYHEERIPTNLITRSSC